MRNDEIEKIVLEAPKGTFKSMKWGKELKTLKGVNSVVTKETKGVIRLGVQYDNIADVKEARENGELPQENQGLPWGSWKKYPYFIEHKGSEYLRVALVNNVKLETKYILDGKVEISKAQAEALCLKSEFPNNDKPLEILTIKMENIKEIK